jgi:glycosyltransferase involved in cell wall biosynthesis
MSNPPLVSVIIPCRNEEQFIRRCLESTLAWNSDEYELEILVVDGCSTDRTREIVSEIQLHNPCIVLLDNPKQNKPAALNIGISATRGKWIVRLDAHAEYPPDYLQRCLDTAKRTGADNVGGIVIARLRANTMQAQLVQALTTHRFGVGSSGFRTNALEGPADTVPFGCYRREVFEKIGCFDERLLHSQDFEFNQRLLRAGGTIWLNPRIRTSYYNQATLKDFFHKVIVRDGPWNPYMWYVAAYSFRIRHAVPMVFVLALIVSALAWWLMSWGWVFIAVIMISYELLAVISAAEQALRYCRWWMFFFLPWLFMAYHVSYGIGELWGALMLILGKAPVQCPHVEVVLR